jgi:putative RecB family exonuclease
VRELVYSAYDMPDLEEIKKVNDLRLSLSKVKTFDSCLAKYNYHYNLHLPGKEWEHFALGHLLHQSLEQFHLKYIDGCNEPYAKIMSIAYKNAMKEFGPKLSEESKKTAYEIIDKYLQKITDDENQMKDILAAEKKFSFALTDRITLNGAIDRIEIDTDGVLTVGDYKSTKDIKWMNDFLQLQTYAFIILPDYPNIKKIRGAYIMLRHNFKRVEKDFSIDEILEVKGKYEDYARKIEETTLSGEWEPNPTNLCNWCDHKDICETGREFLAKKDGIKHGETKW